MAATPIDSPAPPTTELAQLRSAYSTMTALVNDLAGQFEIGPLLERILHHALELLGCDSGSICTVDIEGHTYLKETDLGVGCQSGATFSLDEGVTGEIVRANGPVVFADYAEVRGGHIPVQELGIRLGVIGVPIRWRGVIIGSCIVFSRDGSRRFGDAEVALLEMFASHAAIAITNARLHAAAAARESEAAIAAERERAVRDVHDTLGRGVADVLRHLTAIEGAGDGAVQSAVTAARSAAKAVLSDTRRAVLDRSGSGLTPAALAESIRLELDWAGSSAAMEATFTEVGQAQPFDPETGRQLFRIVQEALTNVVAHAYARSVRIGLVYSADRVSVLVEDDGRGFDLQIVGGGATPSLLSGNGLHGMVARARRLGGSVHLDSTPGWGTRLRAELPLSPQGFDEVTRSRWRVLIVHRQAVVREGLVRMLALTDPDIRVVAEIADPREAVESCELLHPHVVLADIDDPALDGARLSAYLRRVTPRVAVVLLIGVPGSDAVRDAAQNGAYGFVSRDIDAAGLTRAVVGAASGSQGGLLVTAELLDGVGGFNLGQPDGGALTAREREVRRLVERGLADKQIAAELSISVKTVEKHVSSILRKSGAGNRTMLLARSLARR